MSLNDLSNELFKFILYAGGTLFGFYLIFFKKYLEETGKQQAELETIRKKTLEIESIKQAFSKELEPIKSELSVLAEKKSQLFTLEKESIVEFNLAINSLLKEKCAIQPYEFNQTNFEDAKKLSRQLDIEFGKAQVSLSRIELIIQDNELIMAGHNVLSALLKHIQFTQTCLGDVHINLQIEKMFSEPLLNQMKQGRGPNSIADPSVQEILKAGKIKEEAIQLFYKDNKDTFGRALEEIDIFRRLAREYLIAH